MSRAKTRLPVLIEVVRDPACLRTLALRDWDLLLRQAASADMTATLLGIIEGAGLLDEVPAAPREQLEWMRVVATRHQRAVRFEVAQIARALDGLGLPLLLLKGAAYAMAGLPPAAGRMFSDVDILVPKERIGEVEAALMLHGWAGTHQDDYDQRYYREWMHELPPMEHVHRGNAIDVHHAILPETAAVRPDPALLRAAAVPVRPPETGPAIDKLWMLAPHDMVLHSAVHLFSEGEMNHGLRDLLDLHRLLLHFGATPGFWEALPARAVRLELARPLFYALRYAARLLGTPVPPGVMAAAAAAGRPPAALLALMDALFLRALLPLHPSCADRLTPAALAALYLRGNWLRMPPLMLAHHLFHKAFVSPRKEHDQPQAQA
ncbi:nucleotidyltransferase domain-containing protein [Telluria aromaticivorans]|uniref:Nucleotidyltransferase family protein n=1 Tax=Telluria aromaticivorans TaxID=2725995 RepID=A0A7Y2NZR9_9BURK|nr:nucleotidyltransferase family protein [Telluria aromaticivorans]NNG24192.1 nucleotidyltransferase family protein [Telluria aromaticivorans]